MHRHVCVCWCYVYIHACDVYMCMLCDVCMCRAHIYIHAYVMCTKNPCILFHSLHRRTHICMCFYAHKLSIYCIPFRLLVLFLRKTLAHTFTTAHRCNDPKCPRTDDGRTPWDPSVPRDTTQPGKGATWRNLETGTLRERRPPAKATGCAIPSTGKV